MYQKILIAVDLSEMGESVFKEAVSLASKYEANLLLLHVLSPEEDYSPLPIPPNLADIYPAQGNDLTLDFWRQQWEEFEQKGVEMLQKKLIRREKWVSRENTGKFTVMQPKLSVKWRERKILI